MTTEEGMPETRPGGNIVAEQITARAIQLVDNHGRLRLSMKAHDDEDDDMDAGSVEIVLYDRRGESVAVVSMTNGWLDVENDMWQPDRIDIDYIRETNLDIDRDDRLRFVGEPWGPKLAARRAEEDASKQALRMASDRQMADMSDTLKRVGAGTR